MNGRRWFGWTLLLLAALAVAWIVSTMALDGSSCLPDPSAPTTCR